MIETIPLAHSDVLQAAARIAPQCAPTPLLTSHSLDALCGAQLFFKAEHLQRSGAFKFRGAGNDHTALQAPRN
ncbi:MAG: pyridoxal-phosphate dependent enzyme, partial [Oxalobacteraceae bacterium]